MNTHDYLLDRESEDWPSLLGNWSWLLPTAFTLWMVNRFGDTFVILDDGAVHMLDVGQGTFLRVADDREQFAAQLDTAAANDRLLIPLVDSCVEAGLRLGPRQCYGYKIAPALGGA
jgi:hypothetical protein